MEFARHDPQAVVAAAYTIRDAAAGAVNAEPITVEPDSVMLARRNGREGSGGREERGGGSSCSGFVGPVRSGVGGSQRRESLIVPPSAIGRAAANEFVRDTFAVARRHRSRTADIRACCFPGDNSRSKQQPERAPRRCPMRGAWPAPLELAFR